MIWLLAALDLAAGVYLLRWALPRQRQDREGVFAVGVVLLLCAGLLVAIGLWRVALVDPPLGPIEPVPGISV